MGERRSKERGNIFTGGGKGVLVRKGKSDYLDTWFGGRQAGKDSLMWDNPKGD